MPIRVDISFFTALFLIVKLASSDQVVFALNLFADVCINVSIWADAKKELCDNVCVDFCLKNGK